MTEQTEAAVFNPDDYTVEGVRDYLASATADEVGRVKAAEEAGAKRKGILSWEPEKPSVGKDGDDGYTRVDVTEAAYGQGVPAAWGHNALDEGVEGSDTPAE